LNLYHYDKIVPPEGLKRFSKMDKKEAQAFFDWFVGQSEARQKCLMETVRRSNGPAGELDYSFDSLVPLWRWVRPYLKTRKLSAREREEEIRKTPELLRGVVTDFRDLTDTTLSLCIDISYYLAEVFRRKYPQIEWAIWKGRDSAGNRPCLTGFKLPFIPVDPVIACAWRSIDDGSGDDTLRKAMDVWINDLGGECR